MTISPACFRRSARLLIAFIVTTALSTAAFADESLLAESDGHWAKRAEGATGEVARVSGVKLDVSSVHVPGRDFRHYRLKLDEAVARDGTTLKDVDLELIDAGDQQIVLGFKAERHKAGL